MPIFVGQADFACRRPATAAAERDINWARDRQARWNAAEAAENLSNSLVAREYELALPHELNRAQRVELVRGFAAEIANRHGVVVDFAIHASHRNGDERNTHAHVMATTRVLEATGLGEKAQIEWSDTNRRKAGLEPAKHEVSAIQERWAALTNEKLKEQGHETWVDHRSLEAQGIDREPTSHLGPAVSGMERRGIETEVGKRISLEVASRRLEQAAEFGQRERQEQLALSTSIISVSSDLAAAKKERDLLVQKQPEPAQSSPARAPSIEELRTQGREQWLTYRAEQQAKENSSQREAQPAATPEKVRPLTLEEERAQARERWLAYRALTPEQREAHDRAHEQSHGQDGPEID